MRKKILASVLIISAVLFVCIAINVISGKAQEFNDDVYFAIAKLIRPTLTNFMIFISLLGKWFFYVPIAVLLIIIPRSRVKIGIPVAFSLLITSILNAVLKNIFAIPRPNIHRLVAESGYGFPSAHAMVSTVFLGLCVYLFFGYPYRNRYKICAFLFSFGYVILMGFSRIYLGVHSFTDVLGGYFAGIGVLSALLLLFSSKFLKKWKTVIFSALTL